MSLTQREKLSVLAGIGFLGLFTALQVFVEPAHSRIKTLRRVVAEKRQALEQLHAKSQEYNVLRSQFEQIHQAIEHQQRDRPMLSFLERVQEDCGLTQKVVSMQPRTTAVNDTYLKTDVEVRFGAATLEQIVQWLLKIEASGLVGGVKSLEVKCRAENPPSLDAFIQVVGLSIGAWDEGAPSSISPPVRHRAGTPGSGLI